MMEGRRCSQHNSSFGQNMNMMHVQHEQQQVQHNQNSTQARLPLPPGMRSNAGYMTPQLNRGMSFACPAGGPPQTNYHRRYTLSNQNHASMEQMNIFDKLYEQQEANNLSLISQGGPHLERKKTFSETDVRFDFKHPSEDIWQRNDEEEASESPELQTEVDSGHVIRQRSFDHNQSFQSTDSDTGSGSFGGNLNCPNSLSVNPNQLLSLSSGLSAPDKRRLFLATRCVKSTGAVEDGPDRNNPENQYDQTLHSGGNSNNSTPLRKKSVSSSRLRRQMTTTAAPDSSGCGRLSISGPNADSTSTSPSQSTLSLSGGSVKNQLSVRLGLSTYQLKLVQQSWPHIYSTGVAGVLKNIIGKLCDKNHNAKAVFLQFACCDAFSQTGRDSRTSHGRYMLDCLDAVVTGLSMCINETNAYLNEQGALHSGIAKFSRDTVWDDFGEITLEYIRCHNQVRKHKELNRAWVLIITYMIDRLKLAHKPITYGNNKSMQRNQSIDNVIG